MIIKIQFRKSRAKNYNEVILRAKRFSGFIQSQDRNVIIINDIDELIGRWMDFNAIIFSVTKWVGTSVFFNGKELIPYSNKFFYKLLDMTQCYKFYKEDPNKKCYCTTKNWGCMKLSGIARSPHECCFAHAQWYKRGHFIDDKTWKIDKADLLAELLDEAKLKLIDQCPAFDPDRVTKLVKELPDTIRVDNQNWEIIYRTDFAPDGGVIYIPESINVIGDIFDSVPEVFRLPYLKKSSKSESEQEPEYDIHEIDLISPDPEHISNRDADILIDEYLKRKNNLN